MNLNKVMLIGRLGKKPEVNYVQPDVPVARFSIATSEYYKNKDGERVENTEWHNIVSWRNNAKFAESYLDKGMLVYIEGKLQTRKWETQEGVTRYSTDIITDQIKILEKRENRDGFVPTESKPAVSQVSAAAPSKTVAPAINDGDFEVDSNLSKTDITDDLPF